MTLPTKAECRLCASPVGITGWCPRCRDFTTEFDVAKGEQLRDEAEAQVDLAAEILWKQNARAALEYVVRERRHRDPPEFTTDAIWYVLEKIWNVEGPHERRALGPIVRKAANEELIIDTGRFTKTTRAQAHRADVRIWRVA